MPSKFYIKVFEKPAFGAETRILFESEFDRSFRIGRQEGDEPEQPSFVEAKEANGATDLKLVVAAANEREYSRRFAEVMIFDGRIEVKNTSSNQPVFSGATSPLNPNESRILNLPFSITLGNRTISISRLANPDSNAEIFSLPAMSPPSLTAAKLKPNLSLLQASRGENIDGERLVELLQAVMQILQDSPSSQEFFDNAVEAMSQLMNLDHVLIAFDAQHAPTSDGEARTVWGKWQCQSFYSARGMSSEWSPSNFVVDLVERDGNTVYQIPDLRTESLMQVNSLVSSPLKNSENEVIGLIYGDRGIQHIQTSFLKTEAMFIELFANGISIGLERMAQERQVSEMRTRFDQFFTPGLARRLESDPKMLEPRSANVSILFADIRGFSRISERIGPGSTIKWINSVMSQLSDCVLQYDGVVVDYIGDEIMAMWGAPVDQEDHAELAVRAALDMIASIPKINEQWFDVVGEEFDIGIGINSGEAQVGNTGSERKFKYGPLGDVVNVGSRIQSATKQLKARILVTESTAIGLSDDIRRRKIRSVRFVNVARAVTVFEIPFQPNELWNELKTEYETGLEFYEQGKLALASQKIASIVAKWSDDGPAMLLLSDSVTAMQQNIKTFDPVWQLVAK